MGNRLDFHAKLKQLTPNVYFSPPESVKLSYPCIVYKRLSMDPTYADNKPYAFTDVIGYEVSSISKDPDDNLFFDLSKMPKSKFLRHMTVNNLDHNIFKIYY